MNPAQRAGLIDAERSCLLVIDVQERLLPAIHDAQQLLANVTWMVDVATRLGVPVIAAEQYPTGLGPTVASLRSRIDERAILRKRHFSVVAAGGLGALPGGERPQLVIVGIETHVCVLQSVLELAGAGRQTFVVADSVGSRRPADHDLALQRMRGHGIDVISREMAAFEWLREAGTERFRGVLRSFLR